MEEICNQQYILYLFGIAWSFEYEITAFGCEAYTYDPTTEHSVRRSENIRYKNGVLVETTKYKKLPYFRKYATR